MFSKKKRKEVLALPSDEVGIEEGEIRLLTEELKLDRDRLRKYFRMLVRLLEALLLMLVAPQLRRQSSS